MRQRLEIETKSFQGSVVEVCALSASELHHRKGCETLWLALAVSIDEAIPKSCALPI